MFKSIGLFTCLILVTFVYSQEATIYGRIVNESNDPIPFVDVVVKELNIGATTNENGAYEIGPIAPRTLTLIIRAEDYENDTLSLDANGLKKVDFTLKPRFNEFDEVVVSGTMRAVRKSDSPVPVEVYDQAFFQSNPTPSIFESLQNVNGVRPQMNCSVCNTGDVHINGLEGPYTMILIDGMPIVSGLATVYGLNGIPQSLIERVEIVKGPASALYGSEAVGGLINVITKSPDNAPKASADVFMTSWQELNADIGYRFSIGEKVSSLLGINYFNYDNPIDNNNDGFTDVTLQDRVSIFNKWNFKRKDGKLFSLSGRYVYEDRWGGEMNWTPAYRGGNEIYGESIYTNRVELFGAYELPIKEKVMLTFSANAHDQNSVYGDMNYQGIQNIAFSQLTWEKKLGKHQLLSGLAMRYTFYDDNTTATEDEVNNSRVNAPSEIYLPGLFVQDEIKFNRNHTLLLGARYDYNSVHGSIFTPRMNYKWMSDNRKNTLRLSAGSGYRVANVFTEDHAALSGARDVVFVGDLAPEMSWNGNINFVKKVITKSDLFLSFDATLFYTYFDNKIIPDYDTDPTKIIYQNLEGYAVSQGVSLNMDINYKNLSGRIGGTLMDVASYENGIREQQEFQERYTMTWNIGYDFPRVNMKVEYTGNLYGPMELPLLSELDPRKALSDPWSIQNIQVTKTFKFGMEIYGGVKNILDWTPNRGNPFIIARAHDPFDEQVEFDAQGGVIPTAENPYGLTFDPTYIFGPNQGRRFYFGIRYNFK
jgi:outer membrane receptor for ferrienterochelin and colicins